MNREPRLAGSHGTEARGSAAVGRYEDADKRIVAPTLRTITDRPVEVLFEEFGDPFLMRLLRGQGRRTDAQLLRAASKALDLW